MDNLGLIESVSSMLIRGGWVLIPIFLVGWLAWFFIVERYFFWYSQKFSFKKFWKDLEKLNREQAIAECQKYNGQKYFEVLAYRIATKANLGEKMMINWRDQTMAEFETLINKHLKTINVLASMAPLLGLLGTVSGMVHTFENITLFGFGNPVLMADGISEALLTTQAGLIVAFPLVLAGNSIQSKIRDLQDQNEKNILYLIAKFSDDSNLSTSKNKIDDNQGVNL